MGPLELCAHGASGIWMGCQGMADTHNVCIVSPRWHAPLSHQTSPTKHKFKDKISKNWWQLSNQVWGPSECKAPCAALVTCPWNLICFPGFLPISLAAPSQTFSLALDIMTWVSAKPYFIYFFFSWCHPAPRLQMSPMCELLPNLFFQPWPVFWAPVVHIKLPAWLFHFDV